MENQKQKIINELKEFSKDYAFSKSYFEKLSVDSIDDVINEMIGVLGQIKEDNGLKPLQQ